MCYADGSDNPGLVADDESEPFEDGAGPSNDGAAESSTSDVSVSSDSDDSSDDEEDTPEPGEDLLAAAYKEKPKAPPVLKPDGSPSDVQFRPSSTDVAIATMDGDILL
jgi:hypothetical protein